MIEPTYYTHPDPSAVNELQQVKAMSVALGMPLAPHQELIAQLCTEHHPTIPGAWRYNTVVVTMPRQTGKTETLSTLLAQRTRTRPNHLIYYTAQTGKDARDRWADMVTKVDKRFKHAIKIRRQSGAEALTWIRNNSSIRTFAPTEKAIHGSHPPTVVIDEAFAFDEAQGTALLGAIIPAQQTRTDRQLIIVSTAGTSKSTWLKEWVDRGRAAVDDPASNIAYVEYSLAEGLDPYNEDNWWTFHPALGLFTDIQAMRDAAATMTQGEFERSFCNRWTVTNEAVIDIAALNSKLVEWPRPPISEVAFSIEIALDRSQATIYGAYTQSDGVTLIMPFEHHSGVQWLLESVRSLYAQAPKSIGIDNTGANREFIAALKMNEIAFHSFNVGEFSSICGAFISGVETGQIIQAGGSAFTPLVEAAKGVTLRRIGESDAFSRRNSPVLIDALIAAAGASYLSKYTHEAAAPLIVGL